MATPSVSLVSVQLCEVASVVSPITLNLQLRLAASGRGSSLVQKALRGSYGNRTRDLSHPKRESYH